MELTSDPHVHGLLVCQAELLLGGKRVQRAQPRHKRKNAASAQGCKELCQYVNPGNFRATTEHSCGSQDTSRVQGCPSVLSTCIGKRLCLVHGHEAAESKMWSDKIMSAGRDVCHPFLLEGMSYYYYNDAMPCKVVICPALREGAICNGAVMS
jgi:hypothetical protein